MLQVRTLCFLSFSFHSICFALIVVLRLFCQAKLGIYQFGGRIFLRIHGIVFNRRCDCVIFLLPSVICGPGGLFLILHFMTAIDCSTSCVISYVLVCLRVMN